MSENKELISREEALREIASQIQELEMLEFKLKGGYPRLISRLIYVGSFFFVFWSFVALIFWGVYLWLVR